MRDFNLESKRFLHGNTTQKMDVTKVSTQAVGEFHQPVSCFQYKKNQPCRRFTSCYQTLLAAHGAFNTVSFHSRLFLLFSGHTKYHI